MPKRAPKLPTSEIEVFADWVDEGALDNLTLCGEDTPTLARKLTRADGTGTSLYGREDGNGLNS